MREVFVYYRVQSDNAEALLAGVRLVQSRLRERYPALEARVMRRPEALGGEETWMETYAVAAAQASGGVTQAMQREIEAEAEALRPMIAGARHAEVFVTFEAVR
jgi:Domain of unknown function (DUF4936)